MIRDLEDYVLKLMVTAAFLNPLNAMLKTTPARKVGEIMLKRMNRELENYRWN